MALNIDLFKYYSEALEKNNEMIRLHKAKDEQKIVRKRKIFLTSSTCHPKIIFK